MRRFLLNVVQPGVLLAGLIGTLAQVALGFANQQNIGGLADMMASYGLSGYLVSGSLVAALTGLFYTLTTATSGATAAAGGGAVAGGISGALGTAFNQWFGIAPIAAGAQPLINFAAVGATIMSFLGGAPASEPMFDVFSLAQVFGATAVGGGVGAWVGRRLVGRRRAPAH
jgi:hypothetical protein